MLRAAGGGLRSPKVGDWGQVIHTRFSKQMRFLLHCIGGPIPLPSQAMQPLDHLSLNLFIVVCEEGTIARAGERAFMAPSAVSKRISDIEARFGTALLKRSKRGVEPTPAGLALLRHARGNHSMGAAGFSCDRDFDLRGLRGFFSGRLPGLSCQR